MELQWISYFPSKKHGGYWEFTIIPTITIVRDVDQGFALGIGWLFWTFALFIDLD